MLFPVVTSIAPPTTFALKARPWFIGLLIAQMFLAVGRFIIMDLWGAILTLLVALTGGAVIASNGGIDTTYCLYYGVMCLVNGIFDVILFLERWIHVKYSLFSREAPWVFNFASVVSMICPLVELSAAALSAYIYTDAADAEARAMQARGFGPYGAFDPGVRGDSQSGQQVQRQQQRDQGFRPFQGVSHHLNDSA